MAVVATSRPQEDFIVDINGSYGVCFDEITCPRDVVAGEVNDAIDFTFGIFAHDAKAGERVRVMTRGNPSTINFKALTATFSYEDAPLFQFQSVGLILVNQ